jgi:hypothetical protein
MSISLSQLLEESFQIAWEYLERTGELGDGAIASRFLSDTIEAMIRRGQRSWLALSNRPSPPINAFSYPTLRNPSVRRARQRECAPRRDQILKSGITKCQQVT